MNVDGFGFGLAVIELLGFLFYAGPDQILPLVSIIGTIIGFLLIWWKRFVLLLRKTWSRMRRKSQSAEAKGQAQ
jgi:hypothetical protein